MDKASEVIKIVDWNFKGQGTCFIFRTAERTFPTAEYTFPTAERTFRSGEHKPFALLLQICNDYPLNIRITIITTSQHPIQQLPVSRLY